MKVEFFDGLILIPETKEDCLVLAIVEQARLYPQVIHLREHEDQFKNESLKTRFKNGLHIRWNLEEPKTRDPMPFFRELQKLRRERYKKSNP